MATLGLALGGGGARGAAHVGVIRALEERGIVPDIICGTSAGALVGAGYAAGKLDDMQQWMLALTGWRVLKTMDIRLSGGGFLSGEKVRKVMAEALPAVNLEDLPRPFAAVATDLSSGREIWLREGPLLEIVYASCALPGLFTPLLHEGRWLADGGMTNPVPVSLCRALGAKHVIAVDLNRDLLRQLVPEKEPEPTPETPQEEDVVQKVWDWLNSGMREKAEALFSRKSEPRAPALMDVATAAVNIMQDRITRSRMAGDPPEVLLCPRLAELSILDYDKAPDAMKEGRACVERSLVMLEEALR